MTSSMGDNIEYEGKILEIDVDKVKKNLELAGAKFLGEFLQRRYVFDTIPYDQNKWIRLRTNGEKTTLAVKEISNDSIEGTHEWEVVVSDFNVTFEILKKIGVSPNRYEENKRVDYLLDSCSVSIDSWPEIPTYLEIEGENKEAVEACAKKLKLEVYELTGLNTKGVYKKYGIDLDKLKELKF